MLNLSKESKSDGGSSFCSFLLHETELGYPAASIQDIDVNINTVVQCFLGGLIFLDGCNHIYLFSSN
jgi:hypothetical protein